MGNLEVLLKEEDYLFFSNLYGVIWAWRLSPSHHTKQLWLYYLIRCTTHLVTSGSH